jgi:hypothetical protein
MPTFQITARFSGASLFEHYFSDSPRLGNRSFNRPWNEVSGISADPPGGPPGGDPTVLALQAQLVKTWGNH